MLDGRIDYSVKWRLVGCLKWFFGGGLGVAALASGSVEYLLFLGPFRWPVALFILGGGTYAIWRFRPEAADRVEDCSTRGLSK